ncbi:MULTISPECIES: hypothetical protein [Sphingobacterium]|uniref:Uncharacterized protein n=1 Tax=Sphingobacterium litopenaei TaxID=2763500 RepID=A0ABR7YIE4_9SPHI|nr:MULTISPECIES: hypothetical protein [Sphingobacterium]MBD1431085.1 hypothetical protein [Sphingobacterium litopenaei]NGM74718.1 hypothetical protein [Sphingobacterium sp. SGL-16]
MEFEELLKQLFIISFGVLVALVLAFYVVWPKVEYLFLKVSDIGQNKDLLKNTQHLKYAAYERLILFAHRISPYQVMLRHHSNSISIDEFKQLLINDIENEYQHNFTQQLYVSDAAWTNVKDLKESTISLFKNTARVIPLGAKIDDYVAVVLKHVAELEVNPYEAAQIILKKELTA